MISRYKKWRQKNKNRQLYLSIMANDIAGVKRALVRGANPNAKLGHHVPLRNAITESDITIVDALIEGGADPLAGDPFGAWIVPYSELARVYQKYDIEERFRKIEMQAPEIYQKPRKSGPGLCIFGPR